MEADEGKSLVETPTWAVASVVSVMVLVGFFMNAALRHIEKWLYRTKRKALFAALEKIKEELMLFAILSLLMGHWIVYISKICVKSSAISSRFYPCSIDKSFIVTEAVDDRISFNNHSNYSVSRQLLSHTHTQICPEGSSSFASKESLEQLHRFLFALGVTHVTYSFVAIALAMIKIYSWRIWENQAKSMAQPPPQGMRRLSTFIYRNTAHPWSQHNILVWLLCFSRQIWSSINRTDYLALRLGFITTHNLPLSYDFHNYMLRSMEEEFRDIVGISIPLWIFAISCVLLGFHGTYIYFWLSFLPAIFIVLVGTKLHRIVIKLAVETKNTSQSQTTETHRINLRDELFWFGRPRLLLRLIQFISFQNAFEMATCLWSLWEVNETSCFTKDHSVLMIRLTFGIVSQFWCSFITFPLYVIVTQMGSQFKKTIVSENVRESLHTWRRRVKEKHRHDSTFALLPATSSTMSLDSMVDDDYDEIVPISSPDDFFEESQSQVLEVSTHDENAQLVPGRDDDNDCDEIDISCDSERFEPVILKS
ncbi:MLO-like protein 4 isoform X1 [Lactuca sativa]|uniref:MLO-like protein 4 isoform X1 n=1 Tax=Lactuca sativa TaxID=4236 RepID=UPI000CC8490A|nr:MLO-like protein 4 isoform X1 [Lactuca sativa]